MKTYRSGSPVFLVICVLAIVGFTRGEEGGISLGVSYSTYLGGGDCDAIAVDLAGNAYVACHVFA
ncbi:hypothetical protein MYX78_10100 [Acidobacteria bacterium AH-259-G07]|nr:hypothetical protein [Acidobacteria bacterium AH-259-G07]